MIFLQQAPPDTSAYMIAAYIVIFGVMLVYVASLVLRRRNLSHDIEVLKELEDQDS